MDSFKIEVPAGWRIIGELLNIDPDSLSDEQLVVLTEDILQIQTPDSSFVMDVGWYPDSDRQGRYLCRGVIDNKWDSPTECFETRDIREVLFWLQRCFNKFKILNKNLVVGKFNISE
jgi:hypothetical protein